MQDSSMQWINCRHLILLLSECFGCRIKEFLLQFSLIHSNHQEQDTYTTRARTEILQFWNCNPRPRHLGSHYRLLCCLNRQFKWTVWMGTWRCSLPSLKTFQFKETNLLHSTRAKKSPFPYLNTLRSIWHTCRVQLIHWQGFGFCIKPK